MQITNNFEIMRIKLNSVTGKDGSLYFHKYMRIYVYVCTSLCLYVQICIHTHTDVCIICKNMYVCIHLWI